MLTGPIRGIDSIQKFIISPEIQPYCLVLIHTLKQGITNQVAGFVSYILSFFSESVHIYGHNIDF